MPQMAPLNWLILFFFFILTYLLFNILNFYSFSYHPLTSKKEKNSISYNWKW